MAIHPSQQSVENVRRQCINLRRMIEEHDAEVTKWEDELAAWERNISDLNRQLRDPQFKENVKERFRIRKQEAQAKRDGIREKLQNEKQKLEDLVNNFNYLRCGGLL